MIDFDKKITNSDKFRQPALHFQQYGSYCFAPKDTSEYIRYWEEQEKYCLDGFTSDDGDYISGYNYFYLNFCPIMRLVEVEKKNSKGFMVKRRIREREFADFYDYDYYYFSAIQEAEDEGKHMVVLKSRGKGYSFKGASMLCRNYYIIPESVSYAMASEKEFLIKDGILSKAWDLLAFIDKHTAWGKKRQKIDQIMHKKASLVTKDEFGNEIETGFKSEIQGVTLKNDPQKARGKRGKLILWEEAGKFRDILQAWQIARPSVEEAGYAYGLMIAFGTGGEEGEDFDGLRELFYKPSGYNVKGFNNIWDEHADGTECGFFVPEFANMSTLNEDGSRKYMDQDGNSFRLKALEFIEEERRKVIQGSSDSRAIDRYIAEHPITPQEACLELTGNIFPKLELQKQLSKIRVNKKLQNMKQVGDLFYENNIIKWVPKLKGDISKFPLSKDDDPTGSIVIWEHPCQDPPVGLYIAGCLTPGEKVMTDIGLMNVEDIDHSRKLINKDGEIVSINTLLRYQKENESVYKVKMSNTFRTTTFTQEHPLYISKAKYNSDRTINESLFDFTFERMRNVSVGDWVKVPNIYKKYKDISSNEFIQDSRFYYFLGMWLGDGWCDSRNRIHMSFNRSEKNLLNIYKDIISELFDKDLSIRLRNNCYECSFSFKELSQYLNSNFGSGADGKYIPEWVKYSSSERKHALILGYLNTDGCISLDHKRKYNSMEFVSINLELLEAIQDIGFSLGYISCLNKLRSKQLQIIENRIVNSKECYHLRFGNYDTLRFKSNFKEDIINNSKLKKIIYNKQSNRCNKGCFLSNDTEYIYIQIKDIEHSKYTGTVYNFDCDTHTFMCHHITTHNCDPYDHDKSGTNSLGSVFIYKRIQNFEENYEIVVAEYTGRPSTAEDYYENVRRLLLYYNARLLYENERKGIFPYFTQKHCDYLLADQPSIVNDVVGKSKVQRRKGIHMVTAIKDWGEGLIKEWLNEEYAPGEKNLTKIFSEPLLEELIQYNDKGNFDRVMAFMMVMIYRQQLHNIHVKKVEQETKTQTYLFGKPLFVDNYYDDLYQMQLNNKVEVFTFGR